MVKTGSSICSLRLSIAGIQIQGSDGAIALHRTSNLWHPSWDNGQDDFLCFAAGLKCGFQTRYLEPELFSLLDQTDVPVNVDFDDIKMAFPALCIVVPKGHYATDSGGEMAQLVSFSIAYIEPRVGIDMFRRALSTSHCRQRSSKTCSMNLRLYVNRAHVLGEPSGDPMVA